MHGSDVRILMVSPAFPPALNTGGATRASWNAALGLAMAGAQVRVLTTDSGARPRPPRERVERGLHIQTVPVFDRMGGKRFAFAPAFIAAMRREARSADVCIVQGLWTFPSAVACRVCRSLGLPYVLAARGALESMSLSEKSLKKKIYWRLVERADVQGAITVLVVSESERANSAEALRGVRTSIVSNALEPVRRARPDGILRDQLGIPADARILGMSGRIHPRKGFDVLLPALAACRAPLYLVMFGSDEEGRLEGILDQARALGIGDRVAPLGHLPDDALPEVYASIDLLVLPSYGETFGNVVIEALAQGTEVMLSDRVPLGDYVRREGWGTVVGRLTVEDWTAALDAWAARGPSIDREDAARRVREHFDLAENGRALLKLLSGLIEDHRARSDKARARA